MSNAFTDWSWKLPKYVEGDSIAKVYNTPYCVDWSWTGTFHQKIGTVYQYMRVSYGFIYVVVFQDGTMDTVESRE